MSSHELLSRDEFREQCLERDNNECIVPWCVREPDAVHHIIERKLWGDNEGYFKRNGASVCETHHRLAEEDYVPPQAFWKWLDVEPITPSGYPTNITKWGKELDKPAWPNLRQYPKYPSTGHLPFSPEWDGSRVDYHSIDALLDVPLVVTVKQDGSNVALRSDEVVARNGSHAEHESFDMLKQVHSEFAHEIPEHIQIFGEWLYAQHSIHYTDELALNSYLQVFGVYDTEYNVWLGWPEVEQWASKIGYPTVPIRRGKPTTVFTYDTENEFYDDLTEYAADIVGAGHEGIVVRTYGPFHFGQFEERLGKYVREGHVQPDAEHWKHTEMVRNEVDE